jgi:hypothetical protein
VRDALLASVACTRPAVSLKISQLSTVPRHTSPASARARNPSVWSSSHSTLLAEKSGSTRSPVRHSISGSNPSRTNCAQRAAERRHCQITAAVSGSPVRRSHSTTVSR